MKPGDIDVDDDDDVDIEPSGESNSDLLKDRESITEDDLAKAEAEVARFSAVEDVDQFKQFKMKPDAENRFQTTYVREELHDILHQMLKGKKYSDQDPGDLSKNIANTIRNKLEGSGRIYHRYKLVVHVILGEHKGAGVKCGARCLWDPDCDTCVSENFLNVY